MSAPRRNFQLTKVRPSDWLLPSNDATTLWRLTRSTDGWEVWSRPMPASDDELAAIDWASWDEWDHHGVERTRQDAIDAAMRYSEPPPMDVREYAVRDGFLVPLTDSARDSLEGLLP
jgi:hypothetical protein